MDREQRKEVIQEWVRTYVLTENWGEETFMNSMLPFFVWKALLPSSKKTLLRPGFEFMKVVKKSPKNPFCEKLYNCTVSHWLLLHGVEAQHQKNRNQVLWDRHSTHMHMVGWIMSHGMNLSGFFSKDFGRWLEEAIIFQSVRFSDFATWFFIVHF